MTPRTIGVDERRARLGIRHRLAPSERPDDDIAGIARDVVVFHATDPLTVVLSALVRMAEPDPSLVERALFEDRTIVRMLGMRRTLFGVPVDLAPVVQASSTLAVAANQRKLLEALLEEHAVASPAGPWVQRLEHKVMKVMAELGEASATDLTARVPDLGLQLEMFEGKKYAGKVGITSRVLLLMGADGHLVRGRPTGTWTSTRYRWARTEDWLGAPLEPMDPAEAKVELVRRWLDRFGPGTIADLKWWTGWTLGATRTAVAALDTEEVDLDGEPGLVLAGDDAPIAAPEHWVALLPGLDPTAMGWIGRDWYLPPEHRAQLMDRTGNIGPTIWADGRVVGGWAQRKDGRVVTRLLEAIGREQSNAVTAEAERLQEALGDLRVTPRFPAPLDRQLSAG